MRGVPRVQQTGAAAILCMLCTGPVCAGRQTLECNESGQVPGGRGGTIVAQVVNYAEVAPQAGPAPIARWIRDAVQGPDFIQTRAQAAVRRIHVQRNTTPTPGLPGQRIRTESPILKSLIRDASERSQTFRALVAAIDATDGLVYLRVGTCGRLRACLLHRVTLAGEYRVLTILVNLRPPSTDPTPAIGHEFQHVLEVLSDSTITTDERMVAFYRFHGRRIRGVLETDAAIRVGDAVRAELRRAISPRSSP